MNPTCLCGSMTAGLNRMPVWSKNSKAVLEIKGNAAARFPETGLKQVSPRTGYWQERPKSLI